MTTDLGRARNTMEASPGTSTLSTIARLRWQDAMVIWVTIVILSGLTLVDPL
jgi:hypothetical protein